MDEGKTKNILFARAIFKSQELFVRFFTCCSKLKSLHLTHLNCASSTKQQKRINKQCSASVFENLMLGIERKQKPLTESFSTRVPLSNVIQQLFSCTSEGNLTRSKKKHHREEINLSVLTFFAILYQIALQNTYVSKKEKKNIDKKSMSSNKST